MLIERSGRSRREPRRNLVDLAASRDMKWLRLFTSLSTALNRRDCLSARSKKKKVVRRALPCAHALAPPAAATSTQRVSRDFMGLLGPDDEFYFEKIKIKKGAIWTTLCLYCLKRRLKSCKNGNFKTSLKSFCFFFNPRFNLAAIRQPTFTLHASRWPLTMRLCMNWPLAFGAAELFSIMLHLKVPLSCRIVSKWEQILGFTIFNTCRVELGSPLKRKGQTFFAW